MSLHNLKEISDATTVSGAQTYTVFRKVPAIASTAGTWVDLSVAPGNPRPNYYLGDPLTAGTLNTNYGIYHGGSVSPSTKYLQKMCLLGAGAGVGAATFLLCDWLIYYPVIDMDNTDPQIFSTLALPRYTTGEGVQAFLVATNPYVGGAVFNISYTNSAGVSGRLSRPVTCNTITTIATIVNSSTLNTGAFIPLAQGDRGIRSVESITFQSPNGGLGCLVLARPLATVITREITAWAEFDFVRDKGLKMPIIVDGAYLNLLCCPTASVTGVPILGEITTIWG